MRFVTFYTCYVGITKKIGIALGLLGLHAFLRKLVMLSAQDCHKIAEKSSFETLFKEFLDFKGFFCYLQGKEGNKIKDCNYHPCYLIHTFLQVSLGFE